MEYVKESKQNKLIAKQFSANGIQEQAEEMKELIATLPECWNPPRWVHTKCTLTKSGSTGTERKSRDESRRGTSYLLLTGPTDSYV